LSHSTNNTLIGTSTTPPYDVQWNGIAPGVYLLSANVDRIGTTNSGQSYFQAVAGSSEVKVTVAGPVATPSVTLTAPLNNTTVGSPLTLTVNAQNIAGTITTVELYDGTTPIIGYNVNATSSNYTLNYIWEDASSGSHALTAKVTNTTGVTITSAPVTVQVRASPTVNLSAAGAFYLAPANIDLLVGAGAVEPNATLSRIEIYSSQVSSGGSASVPALVATINAPPYRYRLTNLAVGTYRITARAVDSVGSTRDSASFEIRVGTAFGFGDTLPATLNGSTINSNTLSFAATINAPVNSAVTVNGVTAIVTRDGRIVVNGLALNPGTNTITIIVTPPSGTALTQTITVTRTASPPTFELNVNPTQGIAPVASLMQVKDPANTPVAKVLLSCNNPTGSPTLAENESATLAGVMECRYTKAGLYQPWAAVKDQAGNVIWSSTRFVAVGDALDRYAVVSSIYSNVLGNLKSGNVDTALNGFTNTIREKYRATFVQAGTGLSALVDGLGTVKKMRLNADFAEVVVVRNTAQGPVAYSVFLIQDSDGVWRIDEF
jgi:Bacterial Ig domain/Glucodextranase, domain B